MHAFVAPAALAAARPRRPASRAAACAAPPPATHAPSAQEAPPPPPPPATPHALSVLVPGKFDALHVGHRHLVHQAAQLGTPTLLSFPGMAARLNWPPRAPVVAPSDRQRVLRAWRIALSRPIQTKLVPFNAVADMSPSDFLHLLKHRMRAHAIVCGPDWRFGKNARGDVHFLRAECDRLGLQLRVAPAVSVAGGVASSTRVRHALQEGDVALVAQLLGRLHRVVGSVLGVDARGAVLFGDFVNQVPAVGLYQAVVRVIGRSAPLHASVEVRNTRGEVTIALFERETVYCEQCEVYVDFVQRER